MAAIPSSDNRLPLTACTVWLTGLSGAGKSTIAVQIRDDLRRRGVPACILDGDRLRKGLSADLGMSHADRSEQARRVSHVALELANAGVTAIVALVSPYAADRDAAKQVHATGEIPFFEVWVDTPIRVCAERDPKRLYAQAVSGEITNLTGVGSPYESPTSPDLRLDGQGPVVDSATRVLAIIQPALKFS